MWPHFHIYVYMMSFIPDNEDKYFKPELLWRKYLIRWSLAWKNLTEWELAIDKLRLAELWAPEKLIGWEIINENIGLNKV
jgi:hypothetical protein